MTTDLAAQVDVRDDAYRQARRDPVAGAAGARHLRRLLAQTDDGRLATLWTSRLDGWEAALRDDGRCLHCGDLVTHPDPTIERHTGCEARP